jgi:RNA polymerase sigma-70 factor (ECF subfamily)
VNNPPIELVQRSQGGDTQAFAELVTYTEVGVYNLALSLLHDRQEAEDVTQEVFVRVWRALPSFRGEAKLTTWLYRITVNTCLNRQRQLRVELANLDSRDSLGDLASDEDGPSAQVLDRERRATLWAAVDRLPARYRAVVYLFYKQDMAHQEIARLLSIPVGTVKSHLNRARQALARLLGKRSEDEDDAL